MGVLIDFVVMQNKANSPRAEIACPAFAGAGFAGLLA
jgi:hypothetical protein